MRLGPGGGTADTTVSKTVAERCAGSNPAPGTTNLKRLPSGSRFSSEASWPTEPFFVAGRGRRLRASAIGFIPLFPYFAILRSKLREIDIELACPCQEEIEMRVLPAFFQVEKARKGGVRSPLRKAHLSRGVCCTESAPSETKPGKAKAIFSRSTSLPPSRHLPRQRRTARGDRSTGRGHFAPRLRAARDGTSPPASANPCASQSAREATPESASPSSRTPCPSSSRTHTHSRTAPTSR